MMEGQAYIVGLMLMIASPLAIASDEGQAFLENFDRTPDNQVYDVANDRTDMLDELDDSILNDRPNDMDTREVTEDCYTLEQWKERLAERDWNKEDWEQESDEVREEKDDGARGNSDAKEEKEDYNKETDKVTDKVTDKDCFTEAEFEEYVDKMVSKDSADRDCVTVGQVREKWERIREGAHDRDWNRDWDRDDDEREEDEDSDRARGEDQLDDEEDDEVDEEKAELVAVIGELKEACEGGDEAACLELEELLEEYWKDWEQDKEHDWVKEDKDDSECVGKHMMDRMKEKFGRDRGEKDRDWNHEHDWERDNDEEWEELRAFMAELGAACDEGDEEACEELEELITELENDEREHEEECDEHDDDESEEEDEEENWDDDDEDDSEDDEPEEA